MIGYFKKLFSRQYKHKWYIKYFCHFSLAPVYNCEKCNKYKNSIFEFSYICKLSDNEYVIKQILE